MGEGGKGLESEGWGQVGGQKCNRFFFLFWGEGGGRVGGGARDWSQKDGGRWG